MLNADRATDPGYADRKREKGQTITLADEARLAGWPTPKQHDGERGGQAKRAMGETRHGSNLLDFAMLSGWPTPKVATADYQYANGDHSKPVLNLSGAAKLCGWPTPCSQDGPKGGPSQGVDRLPAAASLAGWATPTTRDHKDTGDLSGSMTRLDGKARNDTIPRQAHGLTSSGSPAATGRPGQLNPAFSLWLMGYPAGWVSSGVLAMQLCRSLRRRSSKRTAMPEGSDAA